MPNALIIKPASPKDAAALARLHGESFAHGVWNGAQIEGSLALTTTQGWVTFEKGRPIGFILCQVSPEQAEILTFCVHPSVQRKGVGERLLRYAIEAVRLKGCLNLFLDVAADNTAACKLYEKLGFKVNGRRANYYKRDGQNVDAVLYNLPLLSPSRSGRIDA